MGPLAVAGISIGVYALGVVVGALIVASAMDEDQLIDRDAVACIGVMLAGWPVFGPLVVLVLGWHAIVSRR